MNLSSHVELGHVINKAAARTDRQTAPPSCKSEGTAGIK